MPVSRCIDSAIRHLTQYILGWNDEPHLDAAIWNLTAIAYYEYKYPELMDLPERKNLPLEEIQKYCIFKPSETVPEAMQKNDDIANTKLVQCKECGNYNMLNARAIIFHNKYILCKTCGEKVSILPEINAHD
jgi:DNA-directed RNA polymerase subunit RPC12/RpoP